MDKILRTLWLVSVIGPLQWPGRREPNFGYVKYSTYIMNQPVAFRLL